MVSQTLLFVAQCELKRHCTQVPLAVSQYGVVPLQPVSSTQPVLTGASIC